MHHSFLNSECEHVWVQTKGCWLNAAPPPLYILEPDKKKKKMEMVEYCPLVIRSLLLVITSCTFKFQLKASQKWTL